MKNMPYRIVYRAYAEKDIWEIAEYLSDFSITTAETFLRELKDKIERLTETPLIYPKIDSYREYRKIVVGNYVVVYELEEQTEEIIIIRVVHGKRNYQENL